MKTMKEEDFLQLYFERMLKIYKEEIGTEMPLALRLAIARNLDKNKDKIINSFRDEKGN